MPDEVTRTPTADGSDTLYSNRSGETYHSLNGAVTESRHVFIDAGLMALHRSRMTIFEMGFGTGLNALLTWQTAVEQGWSVVYHSVEAYPLDPKRASSLRFPGAAPDLPSDALARLHEAPWNNPVPLDEAFTLVKHHEDILHYRFEEPFDLVYFDAFSPEVQPELWNEALLKLVHQAMHHGGLLVTYCAKGEVRRRLQRIGFLTERLLGPPGKREMLRARCQKGV